jgi:dTDP-4-amino-4,6-dideoxygalactose transaminase
MRTFRRTYPEEDAMSDPAILGGSPIFDSSLPFMRPTLPPFSEIRPELEDVFQTGMVTKGKYLAEFEARLVQHFGSRYAVGVSSCTTGLMLTYKALDLRGEVVVPSFTFMATVHPIAWGGATPVFAEVDPETWNVDPAAVEEAITPATSGIVATHVFGNPADIEALDKIARRRGVRLVFDAAHGFGALYRGKPLGRYGDAEVFSSSPTKLLVTGEGGVVSTNDAELARRIEVGREYGNPGSYDTEFPGLNARMQEFSAILGLHSLQMLDENAQRRNSLAVIYRQRLGELPGIYFQRVRPDDRCSYKDFSIRVVEEEFGLSRDGLVQALKAEGVDTRNYYDPPVHLHTAYRSLRARFAGRLPVTERLARQCVSLPIFSHMEAAKVEGVCEAVRRIQQHAPAIRAMLG